MVEIICRTCGIKIDVVSKRFKMCSECSRNNRLKRCQDYKKRNKDRISDYNKNYKIENESYVRDYNKKYNIDNRDKIQKRQTEQHRERRKVDANYKMSIVLRNRFRKFYKGKTKNGMLDIVGCSYENYCRWIEFNFDSNMSWENHGEVWHIDHVLFCHLFDHTEQNDIKICFNWKNTRPLLVNKNLSRKSIIEKDLLNHEIRLKYFENRNETGYNHIKMDFAYLATKLTEKLVSGSS